METKAVKEGFKICSVCKRELPYTAFYRNKAAKDNCMNRCKECDKKYKNEWAIKNPERYKESKKKQRKRRYKPISTLTAEEQEQIRAKDRAKYARRNKDKILARKQLLEEQKLKKQQEEQAIIEYRKTVSIKRCINNLVFILKKLAYAEQISTRIEQEKREKKRIYQKRYRDRINREKNKDRIEQQKKHKQQEYYKNNYERIQTYRRDYYHSGKGRERGILMRERMDDCYIRGMLKSMGFPKEMITPELIEFKRIHLRLQREIRQQESQEPK